VKSNEDASFSAGIQYDIPAFDAELFHIGGASSIKMGQRPYQPIMKPLQQRIKDMFNVSDSFSADSDINIRLSFLPRLNMGITLFGNEVAHGAMLELENVVQMKAGFDKACSKLAVFDARAYSQIKGEISGLGGTLSTLFKKEIMHQCV
jgi:hypothetical protein